MGELKYFLGLQIKQTKDDTFIHQGFDSITLRTEACFAFCHSLHGTSLDYINLRLVHYTLRQRTSKRDKVAKRVAKAVSRAFVAALSDIDTSSTEKSSYDEEEESPRKEHKKDKKGRDFTGLCFMADSDHSGDELDSSEVHLSYD
ncbi:hypothetical protein GUJ93_ZPchr0004g39268 [Zizania palustris]|uniref:Uncharacterized protein n=1 Tax=Zizania palustris TaxID=103762 RepID=A0A8J5SNH5_ZIZPA|nr:hypothetical protein GUJ93_ZPchr0004g39268 [Zizania palustris]